MHEFLEKKNNLLFTFLLSITIFSSCKESLEKYPLSWEEEKMVAIIADLRVIDNQVKKHHIADRDSVQSLYKGILYKAHKINEAELINNLELIQNDPKLAKNLEDLVIKRMTSIKDSLNMDDKIR